MCSAQTDTSGFYFRLHQIYTVVSTMILRINAKPFLFKASRNY